MEAIFDILKVFGYVFNFYIKSIQFIINILISNQSWVDLLTVYLSIFIPVIILFSILVRKNIKEVIFNITVHIYCFIMSLPIIFIGKEGLIFIVDGVFQKNINGAFLFWFFSVYNILTLFNRVFVIETAGKRIVNYKIAKKMENKNRNNRFKK